LIGVFPELTSEFTSLEELSENSNVASASGLFANRLGFVQFERWDEPDVPMRMLRLLIVNSISSVLSNSALLLAESKKAVEFMIPTPRVPMVGAN
jgi:hypothetical protein